MHCFVRFELEQLFEMERSRPGKSRSRSNSLPVEVITAATLRLDAPKHQKRLSDTAQSRQPRLLILDPFDPAASATFRWN